MMIRMQPHHDTPYHHHTTSHYPQAQIQAQIRNGSEMHGIKQEGIRRSVGCRDAC
jgi:hypothetical protein